MGGHRRNKITKRGWEDRKGRDDVWWIVFEHEGKLLEQRRWGGFSDRDSSICENLDAWDVRTPLVVQGDWFPGSEEEPQRK